MKILIFVAGIVILCGICFGVEINEIMYNPVGDDYDFEYLELRGAKYLCFLSGNL